MRSTNRGFSWLLVHIIILIILFQGMSMINMCASLSESLSKLMLGSHAFRRMSSSPLPRTPKLSPPHPRLAQVLLSHQRLDRICKQQQPAISLATPTRRIPPLGHRLRNDAHRRSTAKQRRAILTNAHLPAHADTAPCGHAGSAVSEHCPHKA